MKKKISICLLLVFLFVTAFSTYLKAQYTPDSLMQLYHDSFPSEKTYIQTDKNIYQPGDTVWFKAYILAANQWSSFSKSFYVDWYTSDGKLLQHTIFPVYISSAAGQFAVPENYNSKKLYFKAYTLWMLNLDSSFIYTGSVNVSIKNEHKNRKEQDAEEIPVLKLLPEGGNLVEGLTSQVAFIAAYSNGNPYDIIGAIVDDHNSLIDSFASQHDGMGVFSLQYEKGKKYYAVWKDPSGDEQRTPLPDPLKTGITMDAKEYSGKIHLKLQYQTPLPEVPPAFNVLVHMNKQLIYRARIVARSDRDYVYGEFPTNNLMTGVAQITILNESWQPLAERVLFINNHDYTFKTDFDVLEHSIDPRGMNTFEIKIPDSLSSNLSLSVTDGDLFSDKSNNIYTDFLLSDELKGRIYNPLYYFTDETELKKNNLDLVMLTHGWRRFVWSDIIAGKLPSLKFPQEKDFMYLDGSLKGKKLQIPVNQQIILFLQAKDSSRKLLFLPVDLSGHFRQDNLFIYDTIKAFYSLNGNSKLQSKVSSIAFNTGLLNNAYYPRLSDFYMNPIMDSASIANLQFWEKQKELNEKLAKDMTLKSVSVRALTKSKLQKLDERYTSGLFRETDGYSFDVMKDTRAMGSLNIFSYLQGCVAGLMISGSPGNYSIKWRGGTPVMFLDEINVDYEQLENIPMSDIAYVKVIRPPFVGATAGSGAGAIAVYTRKGGDQYSAPGTGMDYVPVSGYTLYKQFYEMDYSVKQDEIFRDLRTTLLWVPYILLDKTNNSIKFSFYNNDFSKKFRIIIEGTNAWGQMTHIDRIF